MSFTGRKLVTNCLLGKADITNAAFTERHVIECQSFRLDISRPDHLTPFLGLVGDEFAEVGGRARQYIGSLYWIVRGALLLRIRRLELEPTR
jgi:hypothetical protein